MVRVFWYPIFEFIFCYIIFCILHFIWIFSTLSHLLVASFVLCRLSFFAISVFLQKQNPRCRNIGGFKTIFTLPFSCNTKATAARQLSDFAELHSLHNICRLSSVVCPPLLQGRMWSPSISSKAYSVLMPFATHKGHLCPCRS